MIICYFRKLFVKTYNHSVYKYVNKCANLLVIFKCSKHQDFESNKFERTRNKIFNYNVSSK